MLFSKKLANWYSTNKRDFPWRETKNPYLIWLSEIILQQTRTLQGLPYYKNFAKAYPTVFDLAKATEGSVLKLWQGLGYYSRARNLHFTAKYIVNNLNGEFPKTYNELLQLKGVGDYTASAIASICYDEKTAVVDGNVYRVLSRYFGIHTAINSTNGKKEFKELAQKLIPSKKTGLHNQAIMDFGAVICTPKKPNCITCIFNDSCFALQKKIVAKLPVKTGKIKIKTRFFNYLVFISNHNQTILNQRVKKDIWLNLYEFPLIETENEIDSNQLMKLANHQKIISENKINSISLFNEKLIIHKLSHQHIYTKFWVIKTNYNLPNSILITSLNQYPVPTLIQNFITKFNF
jgi:A/G-specific adenine glycosylase